MKKIFLYSRQLSLFSLIVLLQSCSKSDEVVSTASPLAPVTPVANPDNFVPATTANIVMYEINPSAFRSTKNLQGIINRLDNIKALGINTIWIMPIYPVGTVNSFGSVYCVKDYTAVRSSLGNLDNLKTLVTTAHQKGMAVILDWVANHTSWDNPWIYAHPEYYTHNTSGQIISPAGTNWNDVADLDFSNTAMRTAMIDAMKFWVINANIDGFRCDAADYVPYDFWSQANVALNAIPNKQLILLAEGSRADHFAAGFQMNFAWDYLSTEKNIFGTAQTSASSFFITNSTEYAAIPSGKKKLRFTTNHDESNISTPISIYGGKNGALAASVVAIYLQGVPMLFSGQEVGVSNTAIYNGTNTIDWSANTDMLSAYTSLLNFYNSSSTARTGSLSTYDDANIVAFTKNTSSQHIAVFVNTRNSTKTYTVPVSLQGDWTNALTGDAITIGATLPLTAFQYLILSK
ncbi:alpha-amylase family glycosyl hydrolase [Flavobacterium sp. SUN046]|uniref:alpha-amylase family glycosyl hydrolase n=1 Tax=Flavobacterium sp. SUN046 TaxID=3002440 RepID=UPI002DBCB909|nr:alpha-amylase family glycosyl hydrolase [Flavobacterium sp. SUN046]MEC4049083.1 alpha-amylase family glycosyl hydrolase [Flavobacterium sp. SUN046]